jgi:hypothetical protein
VAFALCLHIIDFSGIKPEWLTGIGECAAALAFWIAGWVGLREYRAARKLEAANILLEMEKEFRRMSGICNEFEIVNIYSGTMKTVLQKLNHDGAGTVTLTSSETELMKRLDRALRFFYLCTVMDLVLGSKHSKLLQAYYYWMGLLTETHHRKDLADYVEKYYPRLCGWLKENRERLGGYKNYGPVVRH